MDEGTALRGGNRAAVTQVGTTVRRSTGAHTPAVHHLLNHLETSGFRYSPRVLGSDEQGREILSYIEGTVGNYPIPESIRALDALESALAVLRQMHDLTDGLSLPAGSAAHLPPGAFPEVICHWDSAPYNFVFDGTAAVGLIDFDEAGPGRRIDDLAYFAYRFAPLCADENFSDGGWTPDVDRFTRLARTVELYPDERWHSLSEIIAERLDAMCSADRTPRSHIEIYRRDQAFVLEHRDDILAAVSSR